MSEITASATVPFVKPTAAPVVPVMPVAASVPEAEVAPIVAEVPVVPVPEPAAPVVADYAAMMKPFSDELSTTGVLTKESLALLAEKLGAPMDVIELTYEGMRSRQQTRNAAILQAAGGEPTYLEMVQWASTVYTSEEAQAFNMLLGGGDTNEAIGAIGKLRERFTAVKGSPSAEVTKAQQAPPTAPTAPVAPAAKVTPYMNFEELRLAQRDKRYGTDPRYTADVYSRALISKFS